MAQFKKAIEIVTKSANSLAVVLWQDNKPVGVVSTNCDPSSSTTVQRRLNDGTQVAVPCPTSVNLYLFQRQLNVMPHRRIVNKVLNIVLLTTPTY